jgi:hypothetical protein
MMRPNPLTDELPPDIKAELAAEFAELKRWFPPVSFVPAGFALRYLRGQRQPWDGL